MQDKLPTTDEIETAALKQIELFETELHELFIKHGIQHHAVCVAHPAKLENPIILFDDEYESTKLAARMHQTLKERIIQQIS